MVKFADMEKRIDGAGAEASAPLERRLYVFSNQKTGKKTGALLQIADTKEKKAKGLSKRDSLEPFGGMVFPDSRTFWMKDTNFPLDLLFTDKDGSVVDIINMPVDKDGSTVYASKHKDAKDAYELPSGFCDRNDITIGCNVHRKKLRGA